MISPIIILSHGVILAGLFVTVQIFQYIYRIIKSPLWDLKGPPKAFHIMGSSVNFTETEEDQQQWIRWRHQYGSVYSYQGPLALPLLVSDDMKVINHVIMHTDIFQKPAHLIYTLSRVVGPGVLVVEGHDHKLQRRIMNPAFGPLQIRDITSVFVEKALQLGSIFSSKLDQQDHGTKAEIRVDMLSWLNRTTLDIIGLAGFGYEFNSLADSEPNELNHALSTLLATEASLFARAQSIFPAFRLIPTSGGRRITKAQAMMNRIGRDLIAKAKIQAMGIEKGGETKRGRDLLSLLIRANMAAEGLKLSDDAIIAQIPTFFIAGHETTSAAITWTLFALSQSPQIQSKLRQELRAAPTHPTMDELNNLPYLEKVLREVLRLYAPVVSTIRVAIEDTTIPVSKPYFDRYGNARNEIKVSKGDLVPIPILSLHRSKAIWGDDADVFNPDRWDNLPEETSNIPGIMNRLFTFLGGPRACIGYRFALVEMKALIFALTKDFEFELAVPASEVRSITTIVQHPVVKGSNKNQLPMFVRLADC